MTIKNPFKYFKTLPEIIPLAVMYYVRYPLNGANFVPRKFTLYAAN